MHDPVDAALARTVGLHGPNTVTDVGSATAPETTAGIGLATGAVLGGRYRIARFIARGGIGEVYEAHDTLLGEPVAVKVLRPELSCKPGAQERFVSEIRLARKVTHPNVCRVFDVGIDGDRVFLTMELHLGGTLATRLHGGGALDVAAAAPIARQLLAGVGAAHDVHVVHTDLKPSNLLLSDSRVVITDFGLAVSCCARLGCECSAPHLIGTPAYMAPEQVTGGELVTRTDLFAVGVILYEMVTGVLPWQGATATELALARLDGPPPPPRAHRPDLDAAWDQAIRACLARDPADRPGSAAEVARALGLG